MRELISEFVDLIVFASLLIALCLPAVLYAKGDMLREVAIPVGPELWKDKITTPLDFTSTADAATTPDNSESVAEEGATLLGDFQITYYCCELYKHVCGEGTGITASGRPIEAGRSIAVDPSVIPLGSQVWIDFDDGEGWHEYSADDIGALINDNHIDIAIETHQEALRQTKLAGRVCFIPPTEDSLAE